MYAFRLFIVHKNPSKTKHEVLTTQSSGLFSQKSLLQHKKIRNSDCLPNATFSQDKLGQEGSRGELGRVICSLPGCTLCFCLLQTCKHILSCTQCIECCAWAQMYSNWKEQSSHYKLRRRQTHLRIPRKKTWIPIHEYLCHSTRIWIWKTQRKIGEEEPWFKWWLG